MFLGKAQQNKTQPLPNAGFPAGGELSQRPASCRQTFPPSLRCEGKKVEGGMRWVPQGCSGGERSCRAETLWHCDLNPPGALAVATSVAVFHAPGTGRVAAAGSRPARSPHGAVAKPKGAGKGSSRTVPHAPNLPAWWHFERVPAARLQVLPKTSGQLRAMSWP